MIHHLAIHDKLILTGMGKTVIIATWPIDAGANRVYNARIQQFF